MKNILALLFLLLIGWQVKAQSQLKVATQRKSLANSSIAANLHFTNIGPTIMSGRVSELAVNPKNPQEFYVAYASGGLWHTTNFGNSYTPIFDHQPVMTLGAVAVHWEQGIIWVGTGESNSSRSSYAGNGMYKSNDFGKTWQHIGLDESHHIGRIVVHPTNANIAWVAAVGHLYTNNPQRGVYKTTDGGATWQQTLFVNDSTGAIDIEIDPSNPDILYASMWERSRKAWNFNGSGKGSGIYKSTDGGNTWNLITTGTNGFPHDAGVGRIGLAVSSQNPQKIYAILDNQNRRNNKTATHEVTKKSLRAMDKTSFAQLDNKDINDFLDRHNFPQKYNAEEIKKEVSSGKIKPSDLVDYLEDANSMLFDTPVKGAEVYVSANGGKTWHKTHENYIDDLYYSYGYYFGNIRVSPLNDQKLYIMGVPILRSDDGGKNWVNINGRNVHGDHHDLWVSAQTPGLIINGSDGGVHYSFDDGENWVHANNNAVGQFYSVNVDHAKNYQVYGGLQDNGVWAGPHNYTYSDAWKQYGKYAYQSLLGGDGMQVAIDTRDNNTVYTGFQFGNYFRVNKKTGQRKYIKPKHSLGERPLRFNWQSPIWVSVHNQDIIYFGSNKFHRSMDQGNNWETLSGDLTQGGKKGNVPYGTLTTISESPLRFGLIYVGTDDGLVQISKDGGNTWNNVSNGLPKNQWVSRVVASGYKEGRVYVSLNGYRSDDFKAMVYVSEDYGTTWKQLGGNLPNEPINVIKEDPVNENLLFVGTDHAVYFSMDRGEKFMLLDEALPNVPVHDLVIHPQAHDLVIGTHGRSLYRTNIKYLENLTPSIRQKPLHIFDVANVQYSNRWGNPNIWDKWNTKNEPVVDAWVYSIENSTSTLSIQAHGTTIFEETLELPKGIYRLNEVIYVQEKFLVAYSKMLKKKKTPIKTQLDEKENGRHYPLPGKLTLELKVKNNIVKKDFEINKPKPKQERKPQKKIP